MAGRDSSHTLLPTLSGSPSPVDVHSIAQTSIRVLCYCMSVNPSYNCFPPPRPCLTIPLSVLSLAQSKDLVAWKVCVLLEQMNTRVPVGDPVMLSLFFTNLVFPWADDVPNQHWAFYCYVRSAIKPCKPLPPHGSVNKKWNLIKGQVNMKPGQSANIRNLQLHTYNASRIMRMAT